MPKKKGEKMNDYEPTELEEIKSNAKKTNERVDALAELLEDQGAEIKEIRGKTHLGDVANAIREGFANLITRAPASVTPPASAPAPTGFQFDIFSIGWKIKGSDPAPPNPKWGWAFAFTQDGGYHSESEKLVKYLEAYKVYDAEGYTIKLGGRDNKLLQLNKK